MKFLLILSLLLIRLTSVAQSNAEFEGCSGVIFKMPGMSNSDKALVLTTGHCLLMEFPTNKDSSATKEILKIQSPGNVFLYKSDLDLGAPIFTRRIVYAGMNFRDLALIELVKTYEDLSRLDYKVYEIANTAPKTGDVFSFHSLYLQKEARCQIEKTVPVLKEAVFTSKNILRLKNDANCQMDHGNSGTAGIKDNLIYALAFTRFDGTNKACTVNNPCEISKGQTTTAQVGQMYIFPTHFLHRCYNESTKEFDFNLQDCREAL